MKTFYIHANKITLGRSQDRLTLRAGVQTFGTERELARLAAKWPSARLYEIWNTLPGTQPVRRFRDRKTAVRRIWSEAQKLSPAPSQPNRRGTKAEQIVDLLRQPDGATLRSIMIATGWQAHSVRGFVSGQLAKKMLLRVRSFRRNGERVYAIQGQSRAVSRVKPPASTTSP